MNSKATKLLLLSSILVLLLSVPVHAQVVGATLSGTITDSSGGAIVGATISVKNVATNRTVTTTANGSGFYSLPNLPPAEYEVSISSAGFSTAVSKLTLTVGKEQELSVSLKVGKVTEQVTVTGAAATIETTNSTISAQVEATTIRELPLNGRDWASLAALQPGVAGVRTQEVITQVGAVGRGLGSQYSINGSRPTQNTYRLNGVIINDYSNAGPGNVLGGNLGVDAIQEFSVITSNYSAEYGYTSGGVVNAITKSGTNSFHGAGFEFIRDDSLDAANFFENEGGIPRQPFRRNQFGGSAGGPVIKDKFFVFGAYEGLRQHKGIPHTVDVLSNDARVGKIRDAAGVLLPPIAACPAGQVGTTLLDPLASTCVGQNYLTFIPVCAAANNIGPSNNTCLFSFSGKQVVPDNFYNTKGDYKLSDKDSLVGSFYYDHSKFTQPDSFNQMLDGFFVGRKGASLEWTHIFGASTVNTARVGWNYTQGFGQLTPKAINPNGAVTCAAAPCPNSTFAIEPGLHAARIATIGGGPNSAIGFNQAFAGGLNGNAVEDFTHQTVQFFDDAGTTFGKHSLKFGFMFIRLEEKLFAPFTSNGTAQFASLQDFLTDTPFKVQGPPIGGIASVGTFYDFTSIPAFYIQDDWKFRPNLTFNIGLRYEMMTIPSEKHNRIANLPFLYSNPTSPGCSTCTNKMFDSNPTTDNFEPRIGFAWDPFKTGKTSIRAGFGMFDALPLPYELALNQAQTSPFHRNVTVFGCGFITQPPPPAAPTPCLNQSEFPAVNAAVLNQFNNAAAAPLASQSWNFVERKPKRNYVYQWNLNIQRELPWNMTFTAAYASSRAKHNPYQSDDLNIVFPTPIAPGSKRWIFPNPVGSGCLPSPPPGNDCSTTDAALGLPVGFSTNPTKIVAGRLINNNVGEIQSTVWHSKSWYDSLQLGVEKRMSHGFQVQASFTWSNTEDTTSGSFAGDNFAGDLNPTIPWWDLRLIKAKSDFNVSKNFVLNGLWDVPTPKSFEGPWGWIARGWELGGIVTVSSGVPVWPFTIAGDFSGQLMSEPYAIPDVVPGCKLTNGSSGKHGALQWINPACFTFPQAPAGVNALTQCDQGFIAANPGLPANTCINLLGNLGRNTITGPELINFDYSMTKNNPIKRISENFNIQFRAEFFNIFNHPNFAPPVDNLDVLGGAAPPFTNFVAGSGSAIGAAPFGQLTRTQSPERQIQFGVKIIW